MKGIASPHGKQVDAAMCASSEAQQCLGGAGRRLASASAVHDTAALQPFYEAVMRYASELFEAPVWSPRSAEVLMDIYAEFKHSGELVKGDAARAGTHAPPCAPKPAATPAAQDRAPKAPAKVPTETAKAPAKVPTVKATETALAVDDAWDNAACAVEEMCAFGVAPSAHALVQARLHPASTTAFAKAVRRKRPAPAIDRWLYTMSRRDMLQSALAEVLLRYEEQPTKHPGEPRPRNNRVVVGMYLLHVMDSKRRALVGCYEQWLREMQTWLATALAQLQRTGLTRADFARIQKPGAGKRDAGVQAAFELFSLFELLVDEMKRCVLAAQAIACEERRVRPYLDAVGRVCAALVASAGFGKNDYTVEILQILIGDFFTSLVSHGTAAEHAAEYRKAVLLLLKRMHALPAVRAGRPAHAQP